MPVMANKMQLFIHDTPYIRSLILEFGRDFPMAKEKCVMTGFRWDEMAWSDTQVPIGYVVKSTPNMIVIHMGSNNLASMKQGKLIGMVKHGLFFTFS